ncbi:LacI family DNA-binding transcriptional regulator [Phycicoccus sp. CSK15P-2]|uniref:helix-turn-helix domain-containing protein n=1 Tax=Phycicoccus sp. CSK15P-2 TaxID=2807627 RepID=UPI00194DEB43|nr:LacI family DNA-binding transcriptional regulator [Phycicoccus sp. CSK15P-2]MBM6406007.1 LacI family DNA-binding transcriptional regulator [Phycicoccus sp. CSK15P-2]
MARRNHRMRDVADQAGVSSATVDRVLHGRPGVSARAVRAVEDDDPEAVADLLDRVGTGGRLSHGLVLEVPDDALVAAAARRLGERVVPVATPYTVPPRLRG